MSSSKRPSKKPSRAKGRAPRAPQAARARSKAPRAPQTVKARRGAPRVQKAAKQARGSITSVAKRAPAKVKKSRPRAAPKPALPVAAKKPVAPIPEPAPKPAPAPPRPPVRLAGSASSRLTIKPSPPMGPRPQLELSTKVRPSGPRKLSEVDLDEDEVLIDGFDATLDGVKVRITAVLERTCVYVGSGGDRRLARKEELWVEADKLPIRRRSLS